MTGVVPTIDQLNILVQKVDMEAFLALAVSHPTLARTAYAAAVLPHCTPGGTKQHLHTSVVRVGETSSTLTPDVARDLHHQFRMGLSRAEGVDLFLRSMSEHERQLKNFVKSTTMHPILGTLRLQPPCIISFDDMLSLKPDVDVQAAAEFNFINPIDAALDIVCGAFSMGRQVSFSNPEMINPRAAPYRGGGRLFIPRACNAHGKSVAAGATEALLGRLQAQLCPCAIDQDFNAVEQVEIPQDMLGGLAHRAAQEAAQAEFGADVLCLPLVLAWDGCQVHKKGKTATPVVVATPSVTCHSGSNLLLTSRPVAFLRSVDFVPSSLPNQDNIMKRSRSKYLQRQLQPLLRCIAAAKRVHLVYKPAADGQSAKILKVVPYLLCTIQDLAQAASSDGIQVNACPICTSRCVTMTKAAAGMSALEPVILAACQKVAGDNANSNVDDVLHLLLLVDRTPPDMPGEEPPLVRNARQLLAARGLGPQSLAITAAALLQTALNPLAINLQQPMEAIASLREWMGVEHKGTHTTTVFNYGRASWRTGAAAVNVTSHANSHGYTTPDSMDYHALLSQCSLVPDIPAGWMTPPEMLHVWEGGVVQHIVRSIFKKLGQGKSAPARRAVEAAVMRRLNLLPSVKSDGHVLNRFQYGEAHDLIHGIDGSKLRPSVEYRSLLVYLPVLIGLDHAVCTDAHTWSKIQHLLQVAIDLQSILVRSGSWTETQLTIALERVKLLSALYTLCFPDQDHSKLKFHILQHLLLCCLLYGGFRCVTAAPFEKLHSVASIAVALRTNRTEYSILVETAGKLYTVLTRFAEVVHVVPASEAKALDEQLPPATAILLAAAVGSICRIVPRSTLSSSSLKAGVQGLLRSLIDPSLLDAAVQAALTVRRRSTLQLPALPLNLKPSSTYSTVLMEAQHLARHSWLTGVVWGQPANTVQPSPMWADVASSLLELQAKFENIPVIPDQRPPDCWRRDHPNKRWNRPKFTRRKLQHPFNVVLKHLVNPGNALNIADPPNIEDLAVCAEALLPAGGMKLTSVLNFDGMVWRSAGNYLFGGGGGNADLFLSVATGLPFPRDVRVMVVACFAVLSDLSQQDESDVVVIGRFADWGGQPAHVPQLYCPVIGGVAGFELIRFPFPQDFAVHIGRSTDRMCVVRLSSVIRQAVVTHDCAQLERASASSIPLVLSVKAAPEKEIPHRFVGNIPPIADDRNKLNA